ncbi:hypothetical protein V5F49_20680 [Xanthobacter sp. V3C-3]|uniref:hypothetical protein n=1 Tax=Xanthobacter lutulentifluminis TaxID=3119935 RepID=UPI0037266200
MSDIDPIVKAAVDAWLGQVESFSVRAERVPEGALPWLYEAAMVGAIASRRSGIQEFVTAWRERFPIVMAALKDAEKG